MTSSRVCAMIACAWSLAQAQVIPTTTWTDFQSNSSTANGVPLPVGSIVQAFDPQGIMCGEFVTHTEGSYGYLHVYGDDPTTPGVDEGAVTDDTITFRIQGVEAIGVGVWIGGRAIVELHLHASLPSPGRPSPILPQDGATDVNRPALLQWSISYGSYPPVGVTTYRVQVSRDSLFADIVVDSGGIVTENLTVSGLQGGRRYYWRVRVENSVSGEGEYAEELEFLTSVTAIVVLSSPSVSLGQSAVGDTTSHVIYVRNLSEDSIIVSSIATGSVRFSVSPVSGVLAAVDSIAVHVMYHPEGFGDHQDTLFVHSDAATPLLTALLSGSSPQPALDAHPPTVDFGAVQRNGRDSIAVVVSSTTINGIRIDSVRSAFSHFTLRPPTLPVVLFGSDSAVIWVVFAPDTLRQYRDTMVVRGGIVFGGGMLSLKIPLAGLGADVTAVAETPGVPGEFWLEQNFPNPFNPVTEIRYQLSEVGRVRLSVFDLLGREVAVLVNGETPAGTHAVRWDATDFQTGVYIYRLTTGGSSATRRLVFVK